ncbi:unnamed protein product, partial [Polarella glacialis]
AERDTLRHLVARMAEEAESWRPASLKSWLERLGGIMGPSAGLANNPSGRAEEAILEQDEWLRPTWLDPALGGARAAIARRSEEKLQRLEAHSDRLRAGNERLRARCAGAGGNWEAAENEEVQALCGQASALALRVAALHTERSDLEADLASRKRGCLELERLLLSRNRRPSQPQCFKERPDWDDGRPKARRKAVAAK